jgi:hypothetical protein
MIGLRPGCWRPEAPYMNETPATARVRHAVRAVILADDDRVLLCRFSFPHPAGPTSATGVWAAPGGGIEPGELPLPALRRELTRRRGLSLTPTRLTSGIRRSPLPAMRTATTGWSTTTSSSAPRALTPAARCPMTTSPPSTSAGCDGGGTETSPNTAEPTCSHPVTSPHRWRR